jgi:hypothetical protein
MTTDKLIAIVASCLLACGGASAAVYKTVDEHGTVVYTDDPAGNGEPVKLPPLSTVPPPPVYAPQTSQSAEQAGAQAAAYEQLAVAKPAPDETLRDNTGDVKVQVSIKPKLDKEAGDRLQYFLDGQPQGAPTTSDKTRFSNVPRGTHTVEAAVVDASGNELKRSDGVRFYLHRQSVNFPRGPGKPTPLGNR